MRVAAGVAAKGLLGGPNSRQYFALFPNFFILGSPISHFSHTVYPIAADRSRGVFRLYWVGEDGSASERFAREYLTASMRDLHSEDREVITAGQRGLSSGALEHIHFQTQEALCRHLYRCVDALVQSCAAG
jgi:phenylpropionate dioxygenase-like ring-hydroxylating dioxygenase large terminal subunit